jgi:hypothetical protein
LVLPVLGLVAGARFLFAAEETPEGAGNVIRRSTELLEIEAAWPELGIGRVDMESEAFVLLRVAAFERDVADAALEVGKEDPALLKEIFAHPHELTIEHSVARPSARAASILWTIQTYTGGAHPLLEMAANNYDVANGYPLLPEDLFVDPGLAVLLFTRISRRELAARTDGPEEDPLADNMLRSGTEPLEENFRIFTLTPRGIRLYFPPYQVAPWAAGVQIVDVSLEELEAAKPRLEYWDNPS